MERVQDINVKKDINPQIYAYVTPNNLDTKGYIKIGYTERESDIRVREQTQTAHVKSEILWAHKARFHNDGYFKDTDFHSFLARAGVDRINSSEWFYFNDHPEEAENLFWDFVTGRNTSYGRDKGATYRLRDEQDEAVSMTLDYFENNPGGEFLWNAKPRFGKTLASYDLVKRMGARKVLIVTNRPAIANSWYDDFEKFVEWNTDYVFVSESASLKGRKPFSRDQYLLEAERFLPNDLPSINFLSLQDLKGSEYFGGRHDKLKWVADTHWDLLIIDEAHEGVDTDKTDLAFDHVRRNYTLHLSGTPFKQLENNKFNEGQIFNWSYMDEQEAKENWDKDAYNPYSNLPRLNMFTYQMSPMITDELRDKASLDEEENMDFAFDLNEFFSTNDSGKFVYEKEVKKWLDTLTDNEKYPFSTPELRNKLKHTFWFLDRVDSAKALAKLLKNHKVFENYHVIIAAGDGKLDEVDMGANEESLSKVKNAINTHDKTITLSVGQLTTGVTVPEWSAVLMLNNVKSPSLYMQAAFRAQNPHEWTEKDGRGQEKRYQKTDAYIFDFAPERTLTIVDDFANNLSPDTSAGGGTSEARKENIKRLLNFFPVIGEDDEGRMIELDPGQVLTIPRHFKAREVVRRGFMSNLLFANIGGIFQAPRAVLDIINEFDKTEQGRTAGKRDRVDSSKAEELDLDDQGNVDIKDHVINKQKDYIFGKKEYNYEDITIEKPNEVEESQADKLASSSWENYQGTDSLDKLKEVYGLRQKDLNDLEKNYKSKAKRELIRSEQDFKIDQARKAKDFRDSLELANNEEEKESIKKDYEKSQAESEDAFTEEIRSSLRKIAEDFQEEIIAELEEKKEEKKKSSIEDEIRSRLRGFARTIPSFIMAYGDRDLKLENFEKDIPDEVFKEVTGISIEQFRFLRDGGPYEEDGESKEFKGELFDDMVFNQSIQEFLDKKEELADYFEDQEEDIFDYIPNQETNQIFTPKWVVKMMVDQLEEENPGIYDDSSKTFIDLYMKSGLYITEIVKKLYNSESLKQEFPSEEDRLKHIFERQVYGLAPTEIIYRICLSFIFGSDKSKSISQKNFKLLDAYPYAEAGNLEEKLDEVFGE